MLKNRVKFTQFNTLSMIHNNYEYFKTKFGLKSNNL